MDQCLLGNGCLSRYGRGISLGLYPFSGRNQSEAVLKEKQKSDRRLDGVSDFPDHGVQKVIEPQRNNCDDKACGGCDQCFCDAAGDLGGFSEPGDRHHVKRGDDAHDGSQKSEKRGHGDGGVQGNAVAATPLARFA